MSEPEPPAEPTDAPPPQATRAALKTVRVRRHAVAPEPNDEPSAGPPKVLFWFRLACVPVALVAFAATVLAFLDTIGHDWAELRSVGWVLAGLVVFVAYTLPMWWRRPAWWHWVYGLALLLPGILPLTNPISVTLLVFWCMPRTVRFFRLPPPDYVVPPPRPVDGAAPPLHPPGSLFALRWMCALGCVACLIALPVVGVAHAADPNPGWGVLWWLGGIAGAFGLFAVPLFARTPRPWVWWYGVILLVLCSLSLYFTVLAVPILVAWLLKGSRGYFAGGPTPDPVDDHELTSPASHAIL